MRTFDEKVLRKMDYHQVIAQVAGYTVSEPGKHQAHLLRPSVEWEEIQTWQKETTDAVVIACRTGGIPLARFADVLPHMKRLEIGASLNGAELAEIGRVLTNTKEMVRFFSHLKEQEIDLQVLYERSNQLIVLPSIQKDISKTVDETGYVLEEASQALKRIRGSIKQSEHRIREKLDSMIRGKSAKYLSDPLITMRNDRFVLPVKAEYRSQFGGVVHDQSSTGQTIFVEPQVVVELNNRLKEAEMDERREVSRILAELSGKIAPHTSDIRHNVDVLADLDVCQAKARYAKELRAVEPLLSRDREVKLYQARHPLIPSDEVVPNDLFLGTDFHTMVITGPNTGGKTVVLKTLGLIQCMGQTGLHIPADAESQLTVYTQLFVDIGDEQSMEQNLSTFSSHMSNIVSLLGKVDEESLVLLDELGAGTDPQEGAALAIAILDAMGTVGSDVVVTSHYPELKAYGYNRPQTINASMEFNVDTLSPTYRLLIGVPGRSNAFEIAARLGLDPGIIASARDLMSGESQNVEEMITDLDRKRVLTERKYEELTEQSRQAKQLQDELQMLYDEWAVEKQRLKTQAEQEVNAFVTQTQKEAEQVITELRNKQKQMDVQQTVKEHEFIDVRSRLQGLKTAEEQALAGNKILQKAKREKAKQDVLKVGDTVHVTSFGQRGVLIEQASKNEWVVQMGSLKMKLPQSTLEKQEADREEPKTVRSVRRSESVSMQLDLRGTRYEEALSKLDRYLDSALLANYPKVTIIHGMGTGVIRKAVQEALKKHPSVASYEMAPANQGGAGATEVTFK